MHNARRTYYKIGWKLLSLVFIWSATFSSGIGTASEFSILEKAPLSLPRLAPEAHKLGKKPVKAGSFDVIQLVAENGAQKKERYGITYLEIEADSKWRQQLRLQKSGANYVTFTINLKVPVS